MTLNTRYLAYLLGTLFSLFIVLTLSAQERSTYLWPVKLEKDYSKTYPVSSELIAVLNRYGSMKIETWDKNEVKVEAHISVGGRTSEKASLVLDQIQVVDEQQPDRIEFATRIGNWSGDEGGHEIRIDYTVHLPSSARLYAENNYGPLSIGDYKGELELVCKYGTLSAGTLARPKAVTVLYGQAKIAAVNDSKLLFRYSRVDIEKMAGKITANFDYCSSIDLPIDNTLKELQLKNNYTSLYLMAPRDFAADYEISTMNARASGKGEFSIKEEPAVNNSRSSFNNNHKYSGSIGKGGGTFLDIKSNYGNIRFL